MAIRAVNSAGTATTNIMVEGVNIGNAGFGYTNMKDALDAAGNSDTIVATEAFEDTGDSGTHYTATDLLIVAADNALGDMGSYGTTGYRLTGGSLLLWVEGAGTIIRNIKFKNQTSNTNSAVAIVPASGTITIDRCFIQYAAANIGACLALSGAGTVEMRNCVFYKSAGTALGFGCLQDFSTGVHNVRNCLAYTAVNTECFSGGGATTFKCQNCIAIYDGGGASVCYSASGAIGNGNNSSTDATAPGTTSYEDAAGVAKDDLVSVTGGSEDFHWVDYATMTGFTGIDLSGTFTKDIDGETRTGWYLGQDYTLAPPEINVKPDGTSVANGGTYDMGDVLVGSANLPVTVENLGEDDLSITDFASQNATNCTLDSDTPPAALIPGGTDSTGVVAFTPSLGAFSFEVLIENDDANEGTYVVTIEGVGVERDIDIQRPVGNSIADDGTDALGEQPYEVVTNFEYIIENVGGAVLELPTKCVDYANVVGCTVVDNPNTGPTTLNPAETDTFGIDVTPLAAIWSFDIVVQSDDPDEDPYTIHASGTSLVPATGGSRLFGANIFGDEDSPILT